MATLISYDNGMSTGKLIFWHEGKEHRLSFPSVATEVQFETPETLVINDRILNFREGLTAVRLGHKTKAEKIHRDLLHRAMFEVYKITGETEFDISTNCSLDSMKYDDGLGVYEYQAELREIKVKEFRGEEVTLKINNLKVYPECVVGGLTIKELRVKDTEEIIFFDIGSMNFQISRMLNASINYQESYATTHGMNSIYMKTADIVKTQVKGLSTPAAIEIYLKRVSSGAMQPIKEADECILRHLINNTFVEIDERLNEINPTMFAKYVFLGGGSVALKRFIEAKFTDKAESGDLYFVEEPYFANALGMYRRAAKQFGYEIPKSEKRKVKKVKK